MNSASSLAELISVVLVRPQDPRNVGSVARAMGNLGFRRLTLVTPEFSNLGRAKATACWSDDIVDSAAQVPSLAEAIGHAHRAIAFSGRTGKYRSLPLTLSQWVETLAPAILSETPPSIALVFGPESEGLATHECLACTSVVTIPAAVENPSFNLAQAVLVALYELRRTFGFSDVPTNVIAEEHRVAHLDGALQHEKPVLAPSSETVSFSVEPTEFEGMGQTSASEPAGELPAPMDGFVQLDKLIHEAAEDVEFYHKGTPPQVRLLLPHLYRRITPSKREMAILLGFMSRIVKVVQSKAEREQSTEQPGSE